MKKGDGKGREKCAVGEKRRGRIGWVRRDETDREGGKDGQGRRTKKEMGAVLQKRWRTETARAATRTDGGRGTAGERRAEAGDDGAFGLQLIRFQAHVLQQQQRVVCAVPVGVCAVRGGCVAHGLRTLSQIAALGKTGVGWLAGCYISALGRTT